MVHLSQSNLNDAAFAARGERHAVIIPLDHAFRSLVTQVAPFLRLREEGENNGSLALSDLQRLACKSYRFARDVTSSDPALSSPRAEMLANIILMSYEHGCPRTVCRSMEEFHAVQLAHTNELLQGTHVDTFTVTEAMMYPHQISGGVELAQVPGWATHFTYGQLCDPQGIPVHLDEWFALVGGSSWCVDQRHNESARFQTALHEVRHLLAGFLPARRGTHMLTESSTTAAAGVARFFDESKDWLWSGLAPLPDQEARMSEVMAVMDTRSQLVYGTPEDIGRLIGPNFDRVLRAKVMEAVAEQAEASEGAEAQAAVQFVPRFKAVTMLFTELPSDSVLPMRMHGLFRRLVSVTKQTHLTARDLIDQMETVNTLLKRHGNELIKAEYQGEMLQVLVEKVAAMEEASQLSNTLAAHSGGNAGCAVQLHGNSGGSLSDGGLPAATVKAVADYLREDHGILAQATRVLFLKGEETDPMWKLKALLDLLVVQATLYFTDEDQIHKWTCMPEGRHPMLSQFVWSKRKMTGFKHEVCQVVQEVRMVRDDFLARLVFFGDDLGESCTVLKMTEFRFSEKFCTHFWKLELDKIHWYNDFLLPVTNAKTFADPQGPEQVGAQLLTRERLSDLRKYLERLARVFQVQTEGPRSVSWLLEQCELMLDRATCLQHTLAGEGLRMKVDEAFIMAMRVAGASLAVGLLSEDPTVQLKKDFIPITATSLMAHMEEFMKTTENMAQMIQYMPQMLTTASAAHTATCEDLADGDYIPSHLSLLCDTVAVSRVCINVVTAVCVE